MEVISNDAALAELLSICQSCKGHEPYDNPYSSPAFIQYLNRPLTIADIPMESYNIERSSRNNPTNVPWEDSIKNFIFDLTSFSNKKRYSTCILLAEAGYKYSKATLSLLNNKHCYSTSAMILVIPLEENAKLFRLTVVSKGIVTYTSSIEAENLVGILLSWYIPNRTAIVCHSNDIQEYIDCISIMSDCTWSIQCTNSKFIKSGSSKKCKYVCPTYSCQGLHETRAVGEGDITVVEHKVPKEYSGRLNYYLRCIRGSTCASGKCYDCEILFRVIQTVYKTPETSPVSAYDVKFSPTFTACIQL